MKKINPLLIIIVLFLVIMGGVGIWESGFRASVSGFLQLQLHPARLINDYIEIAGSGAAFLNAALVGAIGLILVLSTRVSLSGPTYAAILTMAGFGLFGKTPVNIIPIILGVWISARFVGKSLKDYLIIALFGTALGPLVSALAWETGLPIVPSLLLGFGGGIITGLFLPSIAMAMLNLHQGFNLYNMGLTCGFFGLFAASFIKGFGHSLSGQLQWYTGTSPLLILFIPVTSLLLAASGFVLDRRHCFRDFRAIQKIPGQLPSDFADLESLSGALLNSALIGLLGSAYIYVIKAPFNGPVIGGLLTIMGFGAFGTHLKNSWPIVAGVVLATFLTRNSLAAPGPVLAAIFCTTLGPLAGEFGWKTGLAAGFVHFIMVMQTGSWHGAMNLYNNGFAGGLTAALFVAVIQWYKTNKEQF